MKIPVSACLLGIPCRYDGAGKADPAIEKLRQGGHTLIPVCPEILGGLPTPRPPAERLPDGRVVTREGKDVTAEYRSGAEQALALARKQGCVLAVLKERSPSCGRDLFPHADPRLRGGSPAAGGERDPGLWGVTAGGTAGAAVILFGSETPRRHRRGV